MKKLLFIISMAVGLNAAAQTASDEVSIIRTLYGATKKELVNQYMQISKDKADAFWKNYDAYETERVKLANERLEIIKEYASNYQTLTDTKADELAKRTLKNNIALEKLNCKYYGSTKKIIGAMNAAKFMQLEAYLQTTIRSEIQDAIPFIGEIDKSKK